MSAEDASPVQLAIVIPAYRKKFLGEALDSLCAQTGGGFHVYVGNDASPEPLEAICDERKAAGLPLTYHRFPQNLGGGSDLVAQWNRCVRLSRGEEWVWLFSDDDVASPQCVKQFWEAASRVGPEVNVMRFNSATLDARGEVTSLHPPHPPTESVEAFAYHRLTFQRRSYAPDHIFRRAAFDGHGGFVAFPFALGSDDASWITFAEPGQLVTISGAMVYWRYSGHNVSMLLGSRAVEKLLALADCSIWYQQHFANRRPELPEPSPPVRIDLSAMARTWFVHQMVNLPPSLSAMETWRLAGDLAHRGFGSRLRWVLWIFHRRVASDRGRLMRWLAERMHLRFS